MITITLNDGTVLDNLTLNGNNYVSTLRLDDDIFTDNLQTVTVSDGENTNTYNDMFLVQNKQYGNESWFILAEKSEQQKREESMMAQIERMNAIIEMLTGGE